MKKEIEGAPAIIRIKKAGWIYIALCIFMGVGAINTANNLVYIIVSLMLGFMAVSGVFGVADMARLHVIIGLPEEIYAGKPCAVSIRLRNERKFLPAFLIRVHIEGCTILFPFVDNNSEAVKFSETVFKSRGKYIVENIYISTVFPFNFFTRYKDLEDRQEVLIFPAPLACLSGHSERAVGEKGEKDTSKKGMEAELVSVRNYTPGDPIRKIHWKATARTSEIKVKETAAYGVEPVIIEFDKLIGNKEQKLSCAVWQINSLMEKGAPVGLKIKGSFFPPDTSVVHRLEMLKELALYD